MSEKTKIVIVGAGVAGATLALKLLAKKREFTLINATDYFHVNFAAVRAVVVPGFAEKTIIPLEPCFGEHFKKGKVVKIQPNADQEAEAGGKVILESGEEVVYQNLVIATGTTTNWPIKLHNIEKDTAITQYHELVEKTKTVKSVIIIGGGATGTEVAAEFATAYPDKEVTIVHNSQHILSPVLSERSQQFLQNQLKTQFKIKLVLGERVSNIDELENGNAGTVKTDKDTSLDADIVYKFIGLKVNPEAYKDGLASAMTEKDALKVDNCFRVEGFPNIFALGDCTNLPEPKNAAFAIKHGELMAKNIFNTDKGKSAGEYKPDVLPVAAGCSLGPNSGYGRLKNDWKIPVFLTKKLKSKHLFTDIWWKDLKQKCPQ